MTNTTPDATAGERERFEADAGPYGFDLTRDTRPALSGEPWTEYRDMATGHRWAGWLAARASAAPAAPQWQPIETAPRDGSYFLMANECGVWIGHYEPKAVSGYVFDWPWRSVMLNHWHIADKAKQYERATLWAPLPAAPSAPKDAPT
jgi:hypothetical protein